MVEGTSPSDANTSFSKRTLWLATAIDTELEFESLNSFAMMDEWSNLAFLLREAVGELAAGSSDVALDETLALRRAYLLFDNLSNVRRDEPAAYLDTLSRYVHVAREAVSSLEPTDVDEFRFLNRESYAELFFDSMNQLFYVRARDPSTVWNAARGAVIRCLAVWVGDANFALDPQITELLRSLHGFIAARKDQENDEVTWARHGYPRLLDWLEGMCLPFANLAVISR